MNTAAPHRLPAFEILATELSDSGRIATVTVYCEPSCAFADVECALDSDSRVYVIDAESAAAKWVESDRDTCDFIQNLILAHAAPYRAAWLRTGSVV